MPPGKLRGPPLNDPLAGTAPIFKICPDGTAQLIGTGIWLTTSGHLLTAAHVIDDNIGPDGVDIGPICAVQTLPDRRLLCRAFRRTDKHTRFDLALTETVAPQGMEGVATIAHMLTLEEPPCGARVHTHAFLSPEQEFTGERYPGVTTFRFEGEGRILETSQTFAVRYMARVGFGHVTGNYPEARDTVMLPFPCFQSDMPIYGANSGGPVFDHKGRVCGINCSSYEGSDISFHVPLKEMLSLWMQDVELIPEDPVPRRRSVLELGLAKRIGFDPPLRKILFPWYYRLLLWPYHQWLDACARFRLELRQAVAKHAPDKEEAGK
ncbi:serine protease [Lysobacter sp. Root604]|uniref:S1 family peptidase n=1 Tax=Lysobacter sp. Root604 TaxID=1736568 RepID=UPI0006F75370|nr:serine protease [Lysobacter sp. Root604]